MNENFAGQNVNENPNFGGQAVNFNDQQAPTIGGQQLPNFGGQAVNFNDQQAPTIGGQQIPNFGGQAVNFNDQQAPTIGGQQIPNFDGQAVNFNDQQAPTIGGQQIPSFNNQQPDNMWGNDGFASDEIFNGDNNFDFGARNYITAITDTSTGFASNFNEQNTFGNFGQGNMMTPPMFGNQGGQFNQPQQTSPRQAE